MSRGMNDPPVKSVSVSSEHDLSFAFTDLSSAALVLGYLYPRYLVCLFLFFAADL